MQLYITIMAYRSELKHTIKYEEEYQNRISYRSELKHTITYTAS